MQKKFFAICLDIFLSSLSSTTLHPILIKN